MLTADRPQFSEVLNRGTLPRFPVNYGAKLTFDTRQVSIHIFEDAVSAQCDDVTHGGFIDAVVETSNDWAGVCGSEGSMEFIGEWIGEGTGSCESGEELFNHYFVIHAMAVGDMVCTEPAKIEAMIPDLDWVLVLPWHMEFTDPVDFYDHDAVNFWHEILQREASAIAVRDPFLRAFLDVEAGGGGLLVMPSEPLRTKLYSKLAFEVGVY